MRVCTRCQSEMLEDFDVKVERGQYGIRITKKGMFKKEIEKPRIAICPNCGEISMYISNPELLSQ